MPSIFIDNSVSASKGLTLPVWVVAAARASLKALLGKAFKETQTITIPNQNEQLFVPVSSASFINDNTKALGIAFCNPGECLDITRGLEIWVFVEWVPRPLDTVNYEDLSDDSLIQIVGGIGVGKHASTNESCLSEFARVLLYTNLRPLLPLDKSLKVEIVFPCGQELAKRTSNEAFGVIDGLALIGTQPEVQSSASPLQIQEAIVKIQSKFTESGPEDLLLFVIGENGLHLAQELGFPSHRIVKTGNWLGPLLLSAAQTGFQNLLLFGYHGKLIKLAGGIFHTHHHLADARLEVLIALAVKEKLPLDFIDLIVHEKSVEGALQKVDQTYPQLTEKLWISIAETIEKKSIAYISRYGSWPINIGSSLFDRKRRLRWAGPIGLKQLDLLGMSFET